MKVQVKDFQIVQNASLEFVPGLNVIVGPSNNGKSSILKAIKSLLYTTPGTTPIRSGTKAYLVGISYNGHTVVLQKGQKDSVYLVDGEKYTKFGTNTPEAVSKALNIKELVLNGSKEQLNFWEQMAYPFLLDRTGTELFKFIIDSGEEDQVSQALKNLVSDRQSISKNITLMQGNIETLDTEIDKYNDILTGSDDILSACNGIISLQPKVARLNRLMELKNQFEDLKNKKNELETLTKTLEIKSSILVKCDDIISNNYKRVSTLESLQKRLANNIWSKLNLTDNIKLFEKALSVNLLENDVSKLENYKFYKGKLDKLINQKNSVKILAVETLKVKDNDITLLKTLNVLKSNLIGFTALKNSIVIKPVLEIQNLDFNRLEMLRLYKNRINIDSKEKTTLLSTIDNISSSIEESNSFESMFEVCPYCGNKLH